MKIHKILINLNSVKKKAKEIIKENLEIKK